NHPKITAKYPKNIPKYPEIPWDPKPPNPPSPGPEYTGETPPKEPTARSNRPLIQNALAHCVLAGTPNAPLRAKVLQEMEQSSAQQLLILFRDGGCQFRGVYALGGIPPTLKRPEIPPKSPINPPKKTPKSLKKPKIPKKNPKNP
uniref:CKK domain-containing protein n=1 Tax=Taeniopygia guttata TaxID=59729 RepID=A0A674HPJ7_TAEGU